MERFSGAVFDRRSVFADAFDFAEVLRKYHERNGEKGGRLQSPILD